LRKGYAGPTLKVGAYVAPLRLGPWEKRMTWKTPKIVEVPVGMEINMYACAARK
jgi:coenzyme PQQ precursor peptide PqqA